MASDQDKCQEDNWTVDISDRAGEGEERSSEGTGKSFANELAFELRFKGRKAVSHANMHCKLWEVQVPGPETGTSVLYLRNKGSQVAQKSDAGGTLKRWVKEANRANVPLAHGRRVRPKEAQWAAQSLTAYCEAASSNSFFCPQIKSF